MKDEALLSVFEQTAEKLSIKLAYEDLKKGEVDTPGGIFSLRGEKRILVHKGLSAAEKADVLAEIFAGIDTQDIHLPPDVRERLDKIRARMKKSA